MLPPHLTSLCLNSISHSRTPLTGQVCLAWQLQCNTSAALAKSAALPLLSAVGAWHGLLSGCPPVCGLLACLRAVCAHACAVVPRRTDKWLPPAACRAACMHACRALICAASRSHPQLRHVGGSLLRLELSSQGCRPGGYAVLTALTQLTALRLMFCDHLPACLSVLTTLEELVVRATPVYGRLDGSDVVEQVIVFATTKRA